VYHVRLGSLLRVAAPALATFAIFAALVAAFAVGGAPARAGTTGALVGTVLDEKTREPVADATVSVSSPSQVAHATTDANGRFTFISLAPDTFVVAVSKQGYESLTQTGITIFADQTQSLALSLQHALKEIGRVTARSSLDLVKPGTTSDVYSVDPALTSAAAPVGGGGSLNQAYSALAVLPGIFVPPGQQGVNQTVYIRGGNYDQIGYEYDGVPVNRSFDNYPGHSASTLGQQQLQLYTGGGGAGESASGLAGFINQVAKTGTYPGFANFSGSLGSPTFYHDLSAEVGGQSANRRFSYYLGVSGWNQDFRYFDNFNGAGLTNLFPNATGPSNHTTYLDFYPAVYPTCNKDLTSPLDDPGVTPPPFAYDPGCFATMNPAYGNVSLIEGREAVGNFHWSLPHRNDSGSDDVQFLYTNSSQFRQYYSGIDDAGQSLVQAAVGTPAWPDYLTYPSGTQFLSPANAHAVAYPFPGQDGTCYNQPDPSEVVPVPGQCALGTQANLPDDYRDARWDTASIVKLQFQKNIGSRAYLRLFGYTFYSGTNRSGASRRGIGSGFGVENYDYEVDSHTRGVELQFADALSDRDQLTGWANYVTASTNRVNNYNYLNTPDQQVSNLTNGSQCFALESRGSLPGQPGYVEGEPGYAAGAPAPCNDPITQGTFYEPTGPPPQGSQIPEALNCQSHTGAPIPVAACAAGASWRLTYTGDQGGLNTVRPQFSAAAVNDEWKPFNRLDINLGVRFERDEYDLTNTDTQGKNFWFAAAQAEYCYNPLTLQPVFQKLPPQEESFEVPVVTFNCPIDSSSGTPVQTVHPDGKDGHLLLSNIYNPTLVQTYVLPQTGFTYTVDPLTVLRFSGGRYAQQPQAYEIQYNSLEENLANELIGFLPYGFTTPRHDAQPQYSNNYDFSFEHRFRGTDMSLKLTPYYRLATNQLYEGVSVYGQSPSFNSGIEKSQGIELEFLKGDFNRDGLSVLFSYTYLNSKERWANYAGTDINPVDPYNQYIQQFNALTKAGGGAPCYASSADSTPDAGCGASSIRNPYYASAPQPLLDKNAYYATGLDYPYLSPNVFGIVVNYRKAKFAITPSLTLNEGAPYGNPADVIGIDPRTCSQNQGTSGFTTGNPLNADYTACSFAATPSGNLYVPNSETGHFDSFGQFTQPWQLNAGLKLSYDINPKVRASVTVANLVNRCFGGTRAPWTAAYPPSSTVCGYSSNLFYVNNFYNGSSPNDVAANGVPLNPYFAHSFTPAFGDANSYNYPNPLNIYVQLQVKL